MPRRRCSLTSCRAGSTRSRSGRSATAGCRAARPRASRRSRHRPPPSAARPARSPGTSPTPPATRCATRTCSRTATWVVALHPYRFAGRVPDAGSPRPVLRRRDRSAGPGWHVRQHRLPLRLQGPARPHRARPTCTSCSPTPARSPAPSPTAGAPRWPGPGAARGPARVPRRVQRRDRLHRRRPGQYTVRTDAAGRYRFTGVAPGAFVPCFATRGARGGRSDAAGYVSRCDDRSVAAGARPVTSAAHGRARVRAEGTHGAFGAIAGTVTGANGKPASGIRTRLTTRRRIAGASGRSEHVVASCCASSLPGGTSCVRPAAPGDTCKRVRGSRRVGRRGRHCTSGAAGSLSGVVRGTPGTGSATRHGRGRPHHRERRGFGVGTDAGRTATGRSAACRPGCTRCASAAEGRPQNPTGGRSDALPTRCAWSAGRDRIGVDRTLAPGGVISGTVAESVGSCRSPARMSSSSRAASSARRVRAARPARTGTFVAAGLEPGTYEVCAELDYDTGGASVRSASAEDRGGREAGHEGRRPRAAADSSLTRPSPTARATRSAVSTSRC